MHAVFYMRDQSKAFSSIADSKNAWLEPKFPTECFFMAIQAHHLAILPACRRHSRRQKAHRELTRMIEHLESHESEWIDTPMASRNKGLLKKWREQIKVNGKQIQVVKINCRASLYLHFVY